MNGSNEPAFPCPVMSIRQYAAIKLRVPESGTPWLDAMIRESLRNEFAGQALIPVTAMLAAEVAVDIHNGTRPTLNVPLTRFAELAYGMADAMLAQQSRRGGLR